MATQALLHSPRAGQVAAFGGLCSCFFSLGSLLPLCLACPLSTMSPVITAIG